MFSQYTNKSPEEALKILESSLSGLSTRKALALQEKFGSNEIKNPGKSTLNIIKRQIASPFVYLLFFASLISLAIGEIFDFFVILFIVVANLVIGFFQEYKAEKAVYMLKKIIPLKAKVLRDNKEQFIDKINLVPGDIVLLENGDFVPADIRIIKAHNFLIDESILSGESVPILKISDALDKQESEMFNARNIVFAGTVVVSGRAEGVVVCTGEKTFFGQIAKTIIKEEYKLSSYEKDIFYFSKLVLKIVLTTVILIFVLDLIIKGYDNFFNFLLFSVALIISILPEGLPAVVSFALAKGSMRMAKQNVIVRRLSAIERLGNIDILCTDKTGTLTKNKMSLEKIVSSDKRKCLLYGLLSSQALARERVILNPFDSALLERVSDDFWHEYKKYQIIAELPFDSERMRASYIFKDKKGDLYLIVKGAPEIILEKCSKIGDKTQKKDLIEELENEGKAGKRVLGVAFKKISSNHNSNKINYEDEKNLTFLGYFVFEDPIKETAEEAIKLAKKLGVKIKLITGDSKEVVYHLSKKIKLVSDAKEIISGQELEKMLPDEFDQICEETNVFARISPQLKYKIVKSLQKHHDVGFLGDGINDAPALRLADVGIAVDGSADASREVADVVLLKKDLRVIIDGIESGRNIFANINKYIKCMLASNFGNFYSIAVISLFINYLPMLPIQILLSNLLSDLPLVSIVTDKVDQDELKKPKAYHLKSVLPLIISLAMIITIFDFIFFSVFFREAPAIIQTLWFIESVFCELLLVFIIRTKQLFWRAEKPSSILLFTIISVFVVAVGLPFLSFGQNIFHFTAPGILQLLTMSFILLCFVAVSELAKYIYFRRWKTHETVIN
jgi:Mg2+-importing ATPase